MSEDFTKGLEAVPPAHLRAFLLGLLALYEQGDDEAILSMVGAMADIPPGFWPVALPGLSSIAAAPVSAHAVMENHARRGQASGKRSGKR